jgi:hypothetical protein
MTSPHKSIHDYLPIARSMTGEAFVARYGHPFLLGREVLEEEFHFSTSVTNQNSMREESPEGIDGDSMRIRQWVIAIKKPPGAAGADRIFLGRSEANDVCVPHRTVSKLHAYFVRDPQSPARWFVIDTGSSNGTRHNGYKLQPREKVELSDGDSICFGRCLFQWMAPRTLYARLTITASPPRA